MIDPAGEMLAEKWESYATQLANVENDGLVKKLQNIIENESIKVEENATVFLARDTRCSFVVLCDIC